MNRLALLLACLAASAANTCLAEDPAFCKSMCASEQRACRAEVQRQPWEDRFKADDTQERNPLARTAQGALPSPGTRALDASGETDRRVARGNACDSHYQACTRACAQPQNPPGGEKPKHEPVQIG